MVVPLITALGRWKQAGDLEVHELQSNLIYIASFKDCQGQIMRFCLKNERKLVDRGRYPKLNSGLHGSDSWLDWGEF